MKHPHEMTDDELRVAVAVEVLGEPWHTAAIIPAYSKNISMTQSLSPVTAATRDMILATAGSIMIVRPAANCQPPTNYGMAMAALKEEL